MTLAAGLLAAPLWLATAGGPRLDAPAAMQKIAVEARGPVALVSVTRTMPGDVARVLRAGCPDCGPTNDTSGPVLDTSDRLLDVALPAHAALVDFAVADDHGRWRAAERTTDARATHDYLDRIERLGVKPTRPSDDSFDDGCDVPRRVPGEARPSSCATASRSCPRRRRAGGASASPARPSASPSLPTSRRRSRARATS